MKRRTARRLFPLVLFTLVCVTRAGYAPNVRLDPGLDRFMYRLCAAHGLRPPASLFSQPMTAADVGAFLSMADSLDVLGKLSAQERYTLEQLKKSVLSGRSLYSWQDSGRDLSGHLHGALSGEIAPRYRDSAGVSARVAFTPELKGNAGRLSLFASVDVATEYVSDSLYRRSAYQPYDGPAYNLYGRVDEGHTRAIDSPRGGIRFKEKWIELETAVDHVRLGPAVYNPLTLSGQTPPLTYFRARLDLKKVDYVHLFGLLRSQKDREKYFYAHRLNIPFNRIPLTIGINEVIVNGSTTGEPLVDSTTALPGVDSLRAAYYGEQRGWEWVYMIPFIPFSFAEHYVGDRDNKAVSFDVNLFWPRRLRWYGELFLDDITAPWTLFSDDWGNKWALTAGVQYFSVLFGRDLMALLEYCRVEPWVYTHFYGGSHRYDHFNSPLGATGGPNSDAVRFVLETGISSRNTVGITVDHYRGNPYTRGGSIRHVFQDSSSHPERFDSGTKEFLGDGTVGYAHWGAYWSLMPFDLVRFYLHVITETGDRGFAIMAQARAAISF